MMLYAIVIPIHIYILCFATVVSTWSFQQQIVSSMVPDLVSDTLSYLSLKLCSIYMYNRTYI